jgi:hypothetical protein
LTACEGVRQLIAIAVGAESGDRPSVDSALVRPVVGESRSRIEIRLTVAELKAVELRALASGVNSNRWIAALIRAHVTREPQLGEQELFLLSASNRQLADISRSLGQLVRGKGVEFTNQDLIEVRSIQEQINAHLQAIAGVMRANLDRWSR